MSITFQTSSDHANPEDQVLGPRTVNMSWNSAGQIFTALGFNLDTEYCGSFPRQDVLDALESMDENYGLAASDRPFLATPLGRQYFRELLTMVSQSHLPLVTYV